MSAGEQPQDPVVMAYAARIAELERRLAEIEKRPTDRPARDHTRLKHWAERYALVGVWLLLIVVFGAIRPETFLSWDSFSAMFSSNAVLVVLTLGLLLPLTAGDFDLSVASTLVLSSMTLTILNAQYHWGVLPSILVALLCGVLVGAVNAFFILFFRIHSLIVTLGTGTFIQGIVLWISASQTISGVSDWLVNAVILIRILGVSLSFYYALLLCAAIWVLLEYTRPGRRLLFVGRGREVARLSGIRVDRVRALALIGAATIAAVAGVMYSGMTGSADPLSGLQLLLPAFAGAFLGATSINPGRFNPWGSLIGVYVLTTGITGLTILGIPSFVQSLFYGGGLVIAVAASQLVRRRQPQEFG
ncbi:MAG TPA: ABC transporter permease [Acetobacteraceae bacterium]|nr:ABC transporter permease [Acetobacteraceae bacterium]